MFPVDQAAVFSANCTFRRLNLRKNAAHRAKSDWVAGLLCNDCPCCIADGEKTGIDQVNERIYLIGWEFPCNHMKNIAWYLHLVNQPLVLWGTRQLGILGKFGRMLKLFEL